MLKFLKIISENVGKLKATMQIITIISNGLVDIAEKISQVDLNSDGVIGKNINDDVVEN